MLGEPTTRIAVDVTFLEMRAPPRLPAPSFPEGWRIDQIKPSIQLYRELYDRVGGDYCWWMRRVMPDDTLASLLSAPGTHVSVLREGEVIRGFFDLDVRAPRYVNLSYFGLMPEAIGRGVGKAFLRAAIDAAWAFEPFCVRVNTCSADHERALPGYIAAGFEKRHVVSEIWDIPDRLGMPIPDRLRVR